MVLEAPGKGEGIQVDIRVDSKTLVDWINGKARQKVGMGGSRECPKTTEGMLEQGRQVERKERTIGWCTLFVSTVKRPMPWPKKLS